MRTHVTFQADFPRMPDRPDLPDVIWRNPWRRIWLRRAILRARRSRTKDMLLRLLARAKSKR